MRCVKSIVMGQVMSTEGQLGGMQAGLQHQLLSDITTLSLLSQCPQSHQQTPQQIQERHLNDRVTSNGTLPHGNNGML